MEESTGLLYPAAPGDKPSNSSPSKTGSTRGGLIKTGFETTQIHVSYDRVEPETGESENVAIVEETVDGRGQQGAGLYDGVGGVSLPSEKDPATKMADKESATTSEGSVM